MIDPIREAIHEAIDEWGRSQERCRNRRCREGRGRCDYHDGWRDALECILRTNHSLGAAIKVTAA